MTLFRNFAVLRQQCGNPFAPIQILTGDTGNLAVPGAAGYMMNAGHFRESYVSSGDLNRPRSPEGRNPLGYSPFFSYKRKE